MKIIIGNVSTIQHLLRINFHKNHYERSVAHYTNPAALFSLLKGESPFRLNVVDFMNDSSENRILSYFLTINDEVNQSIKAFIASFTFNHLSLNQYRVYGLENNKHGSGVNIEFGSDFFCQEKDKSSISDNIMETNQNNLSKKDTVFPLPLYRCLYFNPITGYMSLAKRCKQSFYDKAEGQSSLKIDEQYDNYICFLNEKEKLNFIRSELYTMKKAVEHILSISPENITDLILLAIMPISHLIKNSYYEDENECRVAYITTIADTCIMSAEDYRHIDLFYVPYEQVNHHIKAINMGSKIDAKYKLWIENYIKKGKYKIEIGQAKMSIK